MTTEIDNKDQWICRNCMHKGDFQLEGNGYIRCFHCGSLHFVSNAGELFLVVVRNKHLDLRDQEELDEIEGGG